MNNCVLSGKILTEPQLRYTPEQRAITEFSLEISGLRPEDASSTVKVISWGNMAEEIQKAYHARDEVIIEGRLGMNTVEHPQGYKEKRAELTVQRIFRAAVLESTTAAEPAPAAPASPSEPSLATSEVVIPF